MIEDDQTYSTKGKKLWCSIHAIKNLNDFGPQLNLLDLIEMGQ